MLPLLSHCIPTFWLPRKYDLALTSVFQNEALYLKEWIDYHLFIGVEKFFLFSHCSSDDFEEVLRPYMQNGIVELEVIEQECSDLTSWHHLQVALLNRGLQKARKKATWLIICDTDEFFVPKNTKSLPQLLASYSSFGALGVNWQMFGTSHVQKIPSNHSLLSSLVYRSSKDFFENRHIKSIVYVDRTEEILGPHHAKYYLPYEAVLSDYSVVDGPKSGCVVTDKIQVNHYWTRDETYFYSRKLRRRNAWSESDAVAFERAAPMNEVKDLSILNVIS